MYRDILSYVLAMFMAFEVQIRLSMGQKSFTTEFKRARRWHRWLAKFPGRVWNSATGFVVKLVDRVFEAVERVVGLIGRTVLTMCLDPLILAWSSVRVGYRFTRRVSVSGFWSKYSRLRAYRKFRSKFTPTGERLFKAILKNEEGGRGRKDIATQRWMRLRHRAMFHTNFALRQQLETMTYQVEDQELREHYVKLVRRINELMPRQIWNLWSSIYSTLNSQVKRSQREAAEARSIRRWKMIRNFIHVHQKPLAWSIVVLVSLPLIQTVLQGLSTFSLPTGVVVLCLLSLLPSLVKATNARARSRRWPASVG